MMRTVRQSYKIVTEKYHVYKAGDVYKNGRYFTTLTDRQRVLLTGYRWTKNRHHILDDLIDGGDKAWEKFEAEL